MRISILAVGQRLPGWVNDGFETYRQRLPKHLNAELIEVPAAARTSGMPAAKAMQDESVRLLKAIDPADHVVVLDERGKSWSSRDLAKELEQWQQYHPKVNIIIGGADGLDDACKQRANQTWSLSKLTLPHGLVRVLLAEQLYRAWSLSQGHPYHRD